MKRRLVLSALLVGAGLVTAGCAATPAAPGGSGASGGRIAVVASTDVYGQVAAQIGGDAVDVTSIISSPSQDPHEFEASPSDQLAVGRARLLIENGGGYDPFMTSLISASGTKAPVITAVALSPAWSATHPDAATPDPDAGGGRNEHVFYDPTTMDRLAAAIATRLAALAPAHAAEFRAHARAFSAGIASLTSTLDAIAAAHRGAGAFATEPLPGYLLTAAGLDERAPAAFSEAVEAGRDVPPATLLQALALIDAGDVAVVVANAQAGGAETTRVIAEAKEHHVPVLEFTETLPSGLTYLQWMRRNVDELAKALA